MLVKRFTVGLAIFLVGVLLGGCGEQEAVAEDTTSTTVVTERDSSDYAPLPTEDCVRTTTGSSRQSSTTGLPPSTGTTGTSTSISTSSSTSDNTAFSTVSTAVPTTPPTVHTLTPLAPSTYYGLVELKNLPNGAALAEAYTRIVQAVEGCQTTIAMDEKLTEEEVLTVFYHYYADYPQHFWCEGRIRYAVSGRSNMVTRVELQYTMSGDALRRAQTQFNNTVVEILKIAARGKDEYERELLIHNALAETVTYQEGENSHNAYGALVNGKAVCEGYARAFQYLLYQAGIQCLVAEGSSINPSTGIAEGHAWNVVRIGGQYYHVDLTWDDTDDADTPVMYAFFNLNTQQIDVDHSVDMKNGYALPNCTATAANFHVKNGTRLTTLTVESVAAILKDKIGDAHLYCVDGSAVFVEWFGQNHKAVIQAMGIHSGYSYTMLYAGDEVVIRLNVK